MSMFNAVAILSWMIGRIVSMFSLSMSAQCSRAFWKLSTESWYCFLLKSLTPFFTRNCTGIKYFAFSSGNSCIFLYLSTKFKRLCRPLGSFSWRISTKNDFFTRNETEKQQSYQLEVQTLLSGVKRRSVKYDLIHNRCQIANRKIINQKLYQM